MQYDHQVYVETKNSPKVNYIHIRISGGAGGGVVSRENTRQHHLQQWEEVDTYWLNVRKSEDAEIWKGTLDRSVAVGKHCGPLASQTVYWMEMAIDVRTHNISADNCSKDESKMILCFKRHVVKSSLVARLFACCGRRVKWTSW